MSGSNTLGQQAAIIKQIEDNIRLSQHLRGQLKVILAIAERVTQAIHSGNKVLLFGNGGSAADAQHIACELAGKLHRNRPSLPAIALNTNSSSLTAIANDFSFDDVFARQVQGLVKRGDVVIGISTSGSSMNVLSGIQEARRQGAITIAFTGEKGKLGQLADYALSIPSQDTPRIQEAHITAGHLICYLVEEALFGRDEQ